MGEVSMCENCKEVEWYVKENERLRAELERVKGELDKEKFRHELTNEQLVSYFPLEEKHKELIAELERVKADYAFERKARMEYEAKFADIANALRTDCPTCDQLRQIAREALDEGSDRRITFGETMGILVKALRRVAGEGQK